MSPKRTTLQTRLATAGCQADPATGAVTPAIHLATTYERARDGSFPKGFSYTRSDNPTRALLESALADAEGADACAAFASGMAAANSVISAICGRGHLILPLDVYHGVRLLADTTWKPWGLTVTGVDYRGAWESAISKDTCLIWMETPSNPLLQLTDIEAVCRVARTHGIATLVDSTWTTPVLQRPLEFGADLVLHSTTKYIGGHSDVLGGAILARSRDGAFEKIRSVQQVAGAVLDPFSAWLVLRGMRSLSARVSVQCQSAAMVASVLDKHPRVTRVHYPGLAGHAGHEIARRQMSAFGGMLSFEVGGGRPGAMAVAAGLGVFRRATSLGGTESLVEHRASIEPEPATSPEGLLRLSIGLEHPDDLVGDLLRALEG